LTITSLRDLVVSTSVGALGLIAALILNAADSPEYPITFLA